MSEQDKPRLHFVDHVPLRSSKCCCPALLIRGAHCCRDAFDAVYGSSAGAINATYFLSGQREGFNIYTDDIACKEFIDLGRLLNFSGKAQGKHIHDLPPSPFWSVWPSCPP